MTNSILLPRGTDTTDNGPIVFATGMTLSLKYDYHHDDGTIDWTEIEFKEVLAYRFDEWVCADDGAYINFREMAECDASPWLLRKLDKWDKNVGWHQFHIDKGGRSRFRHYMIDFDDQGLLEVIASSYRIIPPSK
jgi:hypothetical protein